MIKVLLTPLYYLRIHVQTSSETMQAEVGCKN